MKRTAWTDAVHGLQSVWATSKDEIPYLAVQRIIHLHDQNVFGVSKQTGKYRAVDNQQRKTGGGKICSDRSEATSRCFRLSKYDDQTMLCEHLKC